MTDLEEQLNQGTFTRPSRPSIKQANSGFSNKTWLRVLPPPSFLLEKEKNEEKARLCDGTGWYGTGWYGTGWHETKGTGRVGMGCYKFTSAETTTLADSKPRKLHLRSSHFVFRLPLLSVTSPFHSRRKSPGRKWKRDWLQTNYASIWPYIRQSWGKHSENLSTKYNAPPSPLGNSQGTCYLFWQAHCSHSAPVTSATTPPFW